MLHLHAPDRLPPNTAACIGAFDGLHLGHRALLDEGRACAERVALVTFVPHPMQVLAPERAPPRLQSLRQRRRVARWLGLDAVVELPFDRSVSNLSPEDFVARYLNDGLAPAWVVVGEDFRYGHARAGTLTSLRADLAIQDISLRVVDEVTYQDGTKLGSSAIRALIADGQVVEAQRALGRVYAVEGLVHPGAQRGRTLGVPTANVTSDGAMLPRSGVYAARLQVTDPGHPLFGVAHDAVVNVGTNPTFPETRALASGLEAHVLTAGFDADLYGYRVEVGFVERLRDERRFDGVDALVAQIDADRARARDVLREAAPRQLELPPPHADDLGTAHLEVAAR